MFGTFYIKKTFLQEFGNWMPGSGWNNEISHADVAFSTDAENFLKLTHEY